MTPRLYVSRLKCSGKLCWFATLFSPARASVTRVFPAEPNAIQLWREPWLRDATRQTWKESAPQNLWNIPANVLVVAKWRVTTTVWIPKRYRVVCAGGEFDQSSPTRSCWAVVGHRAST